jgi:hypothetical protein
MRKQEEKPKYPTKEGESFLNKILGGKLTRLIHNNKHKVLGRINRLLSFDMTWTA